MALTGAALTAVAGVSGVATTMGWVTFGTRAEAQTSSTSTQIITSTAAVVRTDVADRNVVTGTLGFAQAYNLIASGPGVLTRLPPVGQRISRGQPAFEVEGKPVSLFYGSRPVWRAFKTGMSNGLDVQQLEANLKALGYGHGVTVDKYFSSATYHAVRRWQKATHQSVTGTVPLGQIVFAPGPVRVGTQDVKVGTQVQAGVVVEEGTSSEQAVTVQLAPTLLPSVHVGNAVIVTLPDESTRKGKVSAIGAVAVPAAASSSSSGSGSDGTVTQSTAPITITVKGRITGLLDQTQVQVSITAQVHKKVLAVPTAALRAVPGGTYEVIVVTGATLRHVPVETGLFDEISGLAEVSGSGLVAGQRVEVPSDSA